MSLYVGSKAVWPKAVGTVENSGKFLTGALDTSIIRVSIGPNDKVDYTTVTHIIFKIAFDTSQWKDISTMSFNLSWHTGEQCGIDTTGAIGTYWGIMDIDMTEAEIAQHAFSALTTARTYDGATGWREVLRVGAITFVANVKGKDPILTFSAHWAKNYAISWPLIVISLNMHIRGQFKEVMDDKRFECLDVCEYAWMFDEGEEENEWVTL